MDTRAPVTGGETLPEGVAMPMGRRDQGSNGDSGGPWGGVVRFSTLWDSPLVYCQHTVSTPIAIISVFSGLENRHLR